ncbi:MAG TPA: HDOD domain-containing protein [Candidatus Binatus sp.]|nr:HDOD domain-containing protein [Candidatus Binatus sp.]
MKPDETSSGPDGDGARGRLRAFCEDAATRCDLPPLPRVAMQAMAVTGDPTAKAKDVARIVSSDQALATRVLSISRSAVYMRRQAPRTVQDAIVTVGFGVVRQIVVTAAARAVHPPDDPVAEALWAHALVTALAADQLRPPGEPRGGTSFIAGLLHDLGRLVFYVSEPAAFARLGHHDDALEQDLYGVTHSVVGGYLLETWGVDAKIAHAVVEHHVRPVYGLAACVAQADWIAHHLGFGPATEKVRPPESLEHTRQELLAVAPRVAKAFETERRFFA